MITVHHLENSRSHRILWLLEELEVDYAIEEYKRDPKTKLAPASLRKVHPLGKSPVISDEERTVAESGAIIEYILDVHGDGKLRPEEGTDAYLRYRYWMHYAEGSAMTPLLLDLVFGMLPRESPWPVRPLVKLISKGVRGEFIHPRVEQHAGYWEEELSAYDYFAGDAFTAADIQMSFPLEGLTTSDKWRKKYPRVVAYLDRMRNRPAYKRAVDRGGELSLDM
jgi:glutathione S-transferase